MGVALVHGFNAEIAAVENIGPGWDHAALMIKNRVVEVEAVEVEGKAGHRQGRTPDADHGPGGEQQMHAAAVIAGGIGHDQPAQIGVSSHDVVGGFFLAK